MVKIFACLGLDQTISFMDGHSSINKFEVNKTKKLKAVRTEDQRIRTDFPGMIFK